MNIQLNDIVQAEEVLMRLFQARPEKAKDTFRLARLKRALTPVFEDYYEARTKLLQQYAHADKKDQGRYEFIKMDNDEPLLDDEGNKQRDGDAIDAFEKGLKGLLDEEIEVEVKPLTLTNIDGIGLDPALSVAEMDALMWMIKE